MLLGRKATNKQQPPPLPHLRLPTKGSFSAPLNSFLTIAGNLGQDRISPLCFWYSWTSFQTYRRGVHPFKSDTKGRLFVVDVSVNWPRDRNRYTKVLDTWKVTKLNWLRHKSVNNNDNNDCTERRNSRFFKTLSSLPTTRTPKWQGRNRVQITCNTSGAHHGQHVVCHVVRRDSSAIKFDRV